MSDTVLAAHDAGILRLTLNRPRVRNAMNGEMIAALVDIFAGLPDEDTIRAVTITGAGSDFCSGGDMGDISSAVDPDPHARAAAFRSAVRQQSMRLFIAMYRVPQPIVVGLRGHAVGAGVQMAALADLVVASETAKLSLPMVRLGHTVDHGESWALPRKIGLARTAQMLLLGERLDAAAAERYGLANWVVADTDLDAKVEAVARQLAAGAPGAVRGMKTLLRGTERHSFEDQFAREAAMIEQMVATDDFAEAITAFMGKRSPVFRGR